MDDGRTDFELLREFISGDQGAYAETVRRHLGLVYSTALRRVGNEQAAEEVAQNVFLNLARKAWQFAPGDSLASWLYRATLLETKEWWRAEIRRRRREQTAVQLGTTMNTPDDQPTLNALIPLLDEGLLSLRENERAALLLRFYERHSLREVGVALKTSEDAAQKRVAQGLENLCRFFRRRGFRTISITATSAVLEQTALSAPVLVLAALTTTALQTIPPTLFGMAGLVSKVASLSGFKTAAICAAIVVAPLAFEMNDIRAANAEVRRHENRSEDQQTRLLATQREVQSLRVDLQGLRNAVDVQREAMSRNARAWMNLQDLKGRLKNLTADHWPDDLPFVLIPKWARASMNGRQVCNSSGKLEAGFAELMNLDADRKQAVEDRLSEYLLNLNRLARENVYQTNLHDTADLTCTIELTPLAEAGRSLQADLVQDLQRLLKPEDSEVFLTKFFVPNNWLAGTGFAESTQRFSMAVYQNENGQMRANVGWAAHFGQGLPSLPLVIDLPEFLREQFEAFFRAEGITNELFQTQP